MLKVVIIGYGEMFTNMIAGTLDSGATIVGVLRHDRVKYLPPVRRLKEIFNPDCDYNYVKSYGLHEINANSANSDSFRKQLLKLNPDIMIVASWSEKIEKATFDIPKKCFLSAAISSEFPFQSPLTSPKSSPVFTTEISRSKPIHANDITW